MSLKLTILGCHSATPRENANPTAQILEIKKHLFLIDCGEGTQVQLKKNHVKFARIKHVFISHLHGDHFYGLIGLIASFGLLGREADLHVYGPKGIKEVITLQLKLAKSWTNFTLIFHELTSEKSEVVFEDKTVTVVTIPLKHRVYTNGFLFKEKNTERKLNMEVIKQYEEIEVCDYQNLKNGKDFILKDGSILKNKTLTTAVKELSYAFCSDTAYHPSIIPIIHKVDCLYHEATFLEDKEHLTEMTKHSTAKQAASIAKQANAKQLLLGHYSSRYKKINAFKKEAQIIFSNTTLAKDGLNLIIK